MDDEFDVAESPPTILIANDQEWTARAIESIFAAQYRVVRAFTAREALEKAASSNPDLVILDQQLPDYSGVEVCRRLRADPRFGAALPIIITTAGPSGREQRLAAYAAGAWDFYGQPLDADALLHKATVYHKAYRDLSRIRQGLLVDPDTGLYTRRGLARRATEAMCEARRSGRTVACVGWSIATPGESAPVDRASRAMRIHGRAADAIGVIARGEFAIVAPGTDAAGAATLAHRFRDLLAQACDIPAAEVRTNVIVIDDPAAHATDGDALLQELATAAQAKQ